MFCQNCGNQLNSNEQFCPNCGVNIKNITGMDMKSENQTTTIHNKKSKKTVLIMLTIIMLLCITAAFFIFSNQKDNNNKSENNNEIIENNNKENNNIDNDTTTSTDIPKEESSTTKQKLTIATLGHEDHGKTTLTSAITKLYGKYVTTEEIESTQSTSKNGIKYNAFLTEYETPNRIYSHYDFRGHSDIMKSLVSGSINLDGAILVVAATDGVMDQTEEHLKLLKKTGVQKIVVYMSKADMISDDELFLLVEIQIRELISKYGFDKENTPIIKGSALKAIEGEKKSEESIKELITSLDKWLEEKTSNEVSAPHNKFKASAYILNEGESGKTNSFSNGHKAQFVISTAQTMGTIILENDVKKVMPGDYIDLTINLEKTINFKKGDNFKIYENNKIIGVGVITDVID